MRQTNGINLIAISPCPNDTFAFYNIIHKGNYTVDFLDIEELNQALLNEKYSIAKGSFAIMEKIKQNYRVLSAGSAIGKGVGPVLVGKIAHGARIALPGINTTAHKLFQFWEKRQRFKNLNLTQMPFYEMLPALKKNTADAAVLIHEGRFVYKNAGLTLIEDLGAFWEKETRQMIPLGCIYVHKTIDQGAENNFLKALQESIQKSQEAYKNQSALFKNSILPYMQKMAQEKDDKVVVAHVDTYVTEDTYFLSQNARQSIETFRAVCLN
ncbi:MAG: 1,4-dihydroxy-6-naphtoate synthase [Turneriella sp.]|nr:1,4-dihydroxy-6-naphtoate synthase [Turneriella sp.]